MLRTSAPRGLFASTATAEVQERLQCQQGRESEAEFFQGLVYGLDFSLEFPVMFCRAWVSQGTIGASAKFGKMQQPNGSEQNL